VSIYATLWSLRFPSEGDDFHGCRWVTVIAQGVPPHIGASTPYPHYRDGDPYGDFLPPPVPTDEQGEAEFMRAVVFVREGAKKGTPRNGQEYLDPLLVMTGEEYARTMFDDLHRRLCDALRGKQPRVVAQVFTPDGRNRIVLDDGTAEDVKAPAVKRPRPQPRQTTRPMTRRRRSR